MRLFNIPLYTALIFWGHLFAQNPFEGTFVNDGYTLSMQLKQVEDSYHGTLYSSGQVFALQAFEDGGELLGTVYTQTGNYAFVASKFNGGLIIDTVDGQQRFLQIATTHELGGVDMSIYFTEESPQNTSQQASPSSTKSPPAKSSHSLDQYYAGSQLVFYTRTSYVSDTMASSITYMNFCPDGRFSVNYDGSFSVEGNYGGNAHGASSGSNYGTWHIKTLQGQPSMVLQYANGESATWALNVKNLEAGRWRIANTQYALVRNKAVCR